MKAKYKRILLKLSGEGLLGDKSFGVSQEVVDDLVRQIKTIHQSGVDVCLVVGGGNIYRGAGKDMNRSVADQVGMLATVMNGVFLQDSLKKAGLDTRHLSALDIPKVCESYIFGKAISYLEKRRVLIFSGGTGNPFFTTDTAAVLRASEMGCDAVFKATQVDGVYDSDPKKNPNAKRFMTVSFEEVIAKELKVMDMTAIALARDNNIPIVVFAQSEKNSLIKTTIGEGNYTVIRKEV